MRGVTIIGGLQIVLTVTGWCMLGAVLKFHGYPDNNPFVRWSGLTILLREYGAWLLLVSPLWSGIAVTVLRSGMDRPAVNMMVYSLGAAVAILIFTAFIFATLTPFTRPLLLKYD